MNETPSARRFAIETPLGAVPGWRWASPDKPPLLFSHATGFCASAYKKMLSHAARDFDVYAIDLCGHGLNSYPVDIATLKSWRPYADTIAAFLDAEPREGWTLAGHSMGAATSLLAARGRKDIAAFRLIEPVAMPRRLALAAATPFWPLMARKIPLVAGAARRRREWASREAARDAYAKKAVFSAWTPGVIDDYLEDGLRQAAIGFVLACDPTVEAATFAAQANDFWGAARAAPAPVAVLAADLASSTVRPFARRRFEKLGVPVVLRDDVGHLAPMEKPAEIAAFLSA